MRDIKDSIILFALGCLIGWIIGMSLVYCCEQGEIRTSDTVTVVRIDTLWHTDTVPTIVKEQVTKYVTISVPKADTEAENGDSVDVTLPVIQREYSDSTYTAWVSGVQVDTIYPRLDSIQVRERIINKETIITNTIRKKTSRWSMGLQGGYGYGFQYKGFEPYVGVGLSYRIF